MPKLTIDGKEVEVPPGTNLIEAARRLGIEIPHYCYHPGLSIAGACRLCMVDLERAPSSTTRSTAPCATRRGSAGCRSTTCSTGSTSPG
ncbi:MAG: (2Fe-2S)-binding protein [Candidatus Rokubacteria bacterium]|nr:(2Fe-2S)-binding protein [Candidatus Rokubacteria bacterium]